MDIEARRRTETIGSGDDMRHPHAPFIEGTIVAERYRIIRVLGTGGSAIVYEAWDSEVRQEIALKVLRRDKENERSLTRFRREVNIARRIKSPHLLTVYDIGQMDSSVWISMELVRGETLRQVIQRGPLPIDRVIAIATQLLTALRSLHENGVIHRDVKPGNIMITPEGDARLMDLGLARFYEGSETLATTTEHVVGTLEYLSPEQALGETLDPRSDLYSLGLVLFEMLAGRLPFGHQSTLGHLIAHVSKSAPDVRTFRRDASRWLARVVARLTERQREHRYQTAADVMQDLDSRSAALRWRLGSAKAFLIAGAIVVLLSAGTVIGWRQWSDSRFDHLAADSVRFGVAVDRKGRELWRKEGLSPGARAVVAHFEPGEPPVIVGVPGDPFNPMDPEHRVISTLDPQSGEVLRRYTLESIQNVFGDDFSDTFTPGDFDVVDVNHDGRDEVVGIWLHSPYWPSCTVYFDPALGAPRTLFYASGYHRFAGSVDIDGDGIDELILFGVNNRLGWHASLAALNVARVRKPQSLLDDAINGSSPDAMWTTTSDLVLMWYVLLPPYGPATRFPMIDSANRRIVIDGPDEPIFVTFDGFVEGTGEGVPIPVRSEHRAEAYRSARSLLRASAESDWPSVIDDARAGLIEAQAADDRVLASWLSQTMSSSLIHTGQLGEAERHLRQLVADTPGDSNIAWVAATAYHLEGRLGRAIDWYRSVLHSEFDQVEGRKMYEFLEGTVFALGEMAKWDEARQEAALFKSRLQGTIEYAGIYAGWVEWRATGRPPEQMGEGETDLSLYLGLEYSLARSENASLLLERANDLLSRLSGKKSLVDSIRAECLTRLGRSEEAFLVARKAWNEARAELSTSTLVRAHFDLVTDRFVRAARISGLMQEANDAQVFFDAWRYRPLDEANPERKENSSRTLAAGPLTHRSGMPR